MDKNVLIAICSFLGTALGTGGGIFASSKLTAYRIEQLEKKVDLHNGFAQRIPLLEKDISTIYHIINDKEDK